MSNVRRKNKQLVTLEFIVSREGLMGPRSDIERHFAWAKRYFGLRKCFLNVILSEERAKNPSEYLWQAAVLGILRSRWSLRMT